MKRKRRKKTDEPTNRLTDEEEKLRIESRNVLEFQNKGRRKGGREGEKRDGFFFYNEFLLFSF